MRKLQVFGGFFTFLLFKNLIQTKGLLPKLQGLLYFVPTLSASRCFSSNIGVVLQLGRKKGGREREKSEFATQLILPARATIFA